MLLLLQILRWLLLVAEIVMAGPVVYLCILSLSSLIATRRRRVRSEHADQAWSPHTNFAILIPAHNEEGIILTLLESLALLMYPKDLYTVYVIADNCEDKTAELARGMKDVCVYERFDKSKRGKGYVLNWMWQQLEERQLAHDAYIVLDADSVVVPTFLQSMDRELAQGGQALQACNTVLNVTASPSTALRWIALTLINHVRPLGRNGIGGSSTLTGNGMCLSHDLLRRHPWQAFGIAEDYQYYLTLVQHGECVHYVPEAVVRSHMPTTFKQMRTQDVRWEASGPQQSQWHIVWRLLSTGIHTNWLVSIDAAAELLTPPLSFMVAASLIACIVSALLWFPPAMLLSLIILVGVVGYIATAIYLLRPSQIVYKALLHAPGFMLWKLWVYFVLSRSKKHTREWVRTARPSS